MSREEKLLAMETLWADLSADQEIPSPSWHESELTAAEQAVTSGQAGFLDWNEAKRRLRAIV